MVREVAPRMLGIAFATAICLLLCILLCSPLVIFRDLLPGQIGLHLSPWELKWAHRYAYVLPPEDDRGWKRDIYLTSFVCHGGSDFWYNPLVTRYMDEQGDIQFSIAIFSPADRRYMDIAGLEKNGNVTIDSPWIKDKQVIVYGAGILVFEDAQGMLVQISSRIPRDQLVSLVSKIQYIGADVDSVRDPCALQN